MLPECLPLSVWETYTSQKSQNPRYCQGRILINHTDLGSNPAPAASGCMASGKLPVLSEPSEPPVWNRDACEDWSCTFVEGRRRSGRSRI